MESTVAPSIKKFPSLKEHIVESWNLLTKKALKLLLYEILGIVIFVLMIFALGIVILTLIFVSVGFGSNMNPANPQALNSISSNIVVMIAFTVAAIVFIFGIWGIGLALQAGVLMLVRDSSEDTSVIGYFKKGFAYIVPFLITGSISFLILFGSSFVFIIPAIIICIFFIFTPYAVVFEKKKGIDALRMSYSLVSQNFGVIISRLILLWLFMFGTQMLINLLPKKEPSAAIFYFLVTLISSFVFGFFSFIYSIKLYEYARRAYDPKKSISLKWIGAVAIIGWIIFALIGFILFKAISSPNVQKSFKEQVGREFNKGMQNKGEVMNDTYLPIDIQLFNKINAVRVQKELPEFVVSSKLCAYSTRRLKQIEDFGKFDDYMGFYEDTGKKEIWNTFFVDYENVTNIVLERMTGSQNEAEELSKYVTKPQKDSAFLSDKFTDICIRANKTSVAIMLGQKKATKSM